MAVEVASDGVTNIIIILHCYCRLQNFDNMVRYFCGDSTDGLARKFHDYIQSQSRTKNNIDPILLVSVCCT